MASSDEDNINKYNKNYLGEGVLTSPSIKDGYAQFSDVNPDDIPFGNVMHLSSEKFLKSSNKSLGRVPFLSHVIKYGVTKTGSTKNSPMDYSPSAKFATFKFINKQSFGTDADKTLFLLKDNTTLESYKKLAGDNFDGIKSVDAYTKDAGTAINKLLNDRNSATFKFALWSVMIGKANLKNAPFYSNTYKKVIILRILSFPHQ